MKADVKILTVSELIQALEGLCESFGPAAPVGIIDADTGMEMPVIAIEHAADGHLLLVGAGYLGPEEGVTYPEEPTTRVWGFDKWGARSRA